MCGGILHPRAWRAGCFLSLMSVSTRAAVSLETRDLTERRPPAGLRAKRLRGSTSQGCTAGSSARQRHKHDPLGDTGVRGEGAI